MSFGLIPGDSAARVINTAATEGMKIISSLFAGGLKGTSDFITTAVVEGMTIITDFLDGGIETVINNILPVIYNIAKKIPAAIGNASAWVIGSIGDMISGVFSIDNWKSIFTGSGGSGGIIQTIFRQMALTSQFLAVAIGKGITRLVVDMVKGIISHLPSWMQPSSETLQNLDSWASSDTKFDDFRSDDEKKKRAEKDKEKKDKKIASKEKDKQSEKISAGEVIDTDVVKGEVIATPEPDAATQIGYATTIGSTLTTDQLASQGVGVNVAPASITTPTVNNPITQAVTSPTKNTDGSIVTSQKEKSPEEVLLSGILNRMDTLVSLTDKSLKISMNDTSVAKTLDIPNGTPKTSSSKLAGWQPDSGQFLNMPV